LRHADAGHDARRANRAGANSDLDAVRAGIDERARSLGRRDIACDELQTGKLAFDLPHALDDAARMAVRRIDDDDIDAGFDEQRDALVGVDARADGRADAQRAARVLACQRVVVRLLDVFHRDHAAQLAAVLFVDDEHLLDAVLVQEAEHVILVRAFAHGYKPLLRRHDGRYRRVALRLEPQIAVRHDADQVLPLDDGHSGNILGAREGNHVTNGGIGRHRDRVVDDSALEFLDLLYLASLVFRRHVLVNDADAAFLRERDGEARLRNGVHCSRDDGDIQAQGTRKLRLQLHFARQNLGISGL
jgi:hypothetical protein